MTKEEEKKYKRDYFRSIILLKEIEFFSDHLFIKDEYDKDPQKAIKQYIDEQIYLKYDFLPLNLLRESISSFNSYCENNDKLTKKKRKLNKELEFINHLRNKVSGHLSDEAIDKMVQWIPEIYDENAKQNTTYQEYQIYRGLLEVAINSYQDTDGNQKQFGKEIDIQIPEYKKLFDDYLLETVNDAINFLECIQDVIRPNLIYFEYPKDERSKEEKIAFCKQLIELSEECAENPDKIDENTLKMKEMYKKAGLDLDAFKEAAETDFKLSIKGR